MNLVLERRLLGLCSGYSVSAQVRLKPRDLNLTVMDASSNLFFLGPDLLKLTVNQVQATLGRVIVYFKHINAFSTA